MLAWIRIGSTKDVPQRGEDVPWGPASQYRLNYWLQCRRDLPNSRRKGSKNSLLCYENWIVWRALSTDQPNRTVLRKDCSIYIPSANLSYKTYSRSQNCSLRYKIIEYFIGCQVQCQSSRFWVCSVFSRLNTTTYQLFCLRWSWITKIKCSGNY